MRSRRSPARRALCRAGTSGRLWPGQLLELMPRSAPVNLRQRTRRADDESSLNQSAQPMQYTGVSARSAIATTSSNVA